MSNQEKTTAHNGIAPETENASEGDELGEVSADDLINDAEVSVGQLEKAKRKIIPALVEERVKNGMSQEEAEADAKRIFQEVVDEKRVEETYRFGEFDSDFLKVYMEDSFLGGVSLEVTKIPDTQAPTAYVGSRPNGKNYEIVMGFNPKFFRSLNPLQRAGVIKHEMYHLVFQHIFDRAVGDKEYQTMWNWATDLAINSIIKKENLPDMCLIPGHTPTDPKTGEPIEGPYAEFIQNAPHMESSDFYFEKLREIQQKNGKDSIDVAIAAGLGTMDDHGNWGKLPKHVQDAIREKVSDILGKAVKRAERDNSWGSVPHEIQQIIRRLLSREVDWRSVLRGFTGRCRTMDRISTVKRINKKAPYMFPGVKRKYVSKFAVFIDQSGSMSDDDISLLFSELEEAAKYTDLDVFHFDTEIDLKSRTTWSKGKRFPSAHRTRSGGTSFECISNFLNKHENRSSWSGAFILTDGYALTMPQVIGTKIMWVVTENGTMEHIRNGDLAVKMKAERTFKRY